MTALRVSGAASALVCALAGPQTSDESSTSAANLADSATLTNQLALATPVATVVTLTCRAGNYVLISKSLTSLRVGAVTAVVAPDVF